MLFFFLLQFSGSTQEVAIEYSSFRSKFNVYIYGYKRAIASLPVKYGDSSKDFFYDEKDVRWFFFFQLMDWYLFLWYMENFNMHSNLVDSISMQFYYQIDVLSNKHFLQLRIQSVIGCLHLLCSFSFFFFIQKHLGDISKYITKQC